MSVSRRLLGALLVCLISTLTPLAFASLPDPLWIGGFWDDGDFDEVVDFITGQIHGIVIALIPDVELQARPELLKEAPQRFVLSAPRSTSHSRAPPPASTAQS